MCQRLKIQKNLKFLHLKSVPRRDKGGKQGRLPQNKMMASVAGGCDGCAKSSGLLCVEEVGTQA